MWCCRVMVAHEHHVLVTVQLHHSASQHPRLLRSCILVAVLTSPFDEPCVCCQHVAVQCMAEGSTMCPCMWVMLCLVAGGYQGVIQARSVCIKVLYECTFHACTYVAVLGACLKLDEAAIVSWCLAATDEVAYLWSACLVVHLLLIGSASSASAVCAGRPGEVLDAAGHGSVRGGPGQ
jgi:hypothetical protein